MTKRQQEGPEQEGPGQPIMRKVSLNPVEGMIGSPGMTVYSVEVFAWDGSKRVTEVAEGKKFWIHVSYTSAWPEGSVSFWDPWTVGFSAKCLEIEGLFAFGWTRTNESPHTEIMEIPDPQAGFLFGILTDVWFRMPNRDISFRVRPWGNPAWTYSYPPTDTW